jgi:cyclophilin family peptidyl-prolyl cis-trans isomerase/protein-disulfide isomerase
MQKITSLFIILITLSACSPSPTIPVVGNPTTSTITLPTPPSCTDLIVEPTPGPETPSLFPPENDTDYALGSIDPTLTIITYVDYQDSRSKSFVDTINRIVNEHPDDIRVIQRIYPLIGVNDKSALAAQAALAADEQGKLREMHDLLFSQQGAWSILPEQDFEQWLSAQAADLDLDVDQFQSDLKREDIVDSVRQAWEEDQQIGIPGVPLILINGQIYAGPRDYGSLNDILQLILLGKRQFASCPPVTVQSNRQYLATLKTEKGDIVIQLFADKAPITVNSFLFLARNGWYDGITFHRVIPDLFAQTGDPSGTGKGNPGYYIITEIDPTLKFNKPGMVAMVNSGPDTSGSQFFITYAPAAQFDGQYTIFGQVLSGMEILESLTPRDALPGTETPPGNRLLRVTIEEK